MTRRRHIPVHDGPRRRLTFGVHILALVTAILTLDTVIAILGGWRTESHVEQCFMLAAAVIFAGCAVCLLVPGLKELSKRLPRGLQAVLFGIVFAILLVELPLRVVVSRQATRRFHTRDPNLSMTFRPDPQVMSGISGPARVTTNAVGIRGPELPPREDAYRILCIGGSTTECLYLDDEETWPHLLMQRLSGAGTGRQVWVGNVGVSGMRAEDHLQFVESSRLATQIDCLLCLVGINDFQKALKDPNDSGEPAGPLWQRSAVWTVVMEQWKSVRTTDSFFNLRLEDSAGRVYVERRNFRQQARRCTELPSLDAALGRYHSCIERIINACRAKGASPIFINQPVLWGEGLSPQAERSLWIGRTEEGAYLSAAVARRGMEMFNAVLMQTCEDSAVQCIDVSAMSGREDLFYDDCHFNEAGSRELARLIAAWFNVYFKETTVEPGMAQTRSPTRPPGGP